MVIIGSKVWPVVVVVVFAQQKNMERKGKERMI